MLRIEIPVDGPAKLNLRKFKELELPVPPHGIDSEETGNVVLIFEDEQQAIDYSLELDHFSEALNNHQSPRYKAAGEITKAIGEDEFVKSYLED